MKIKIIIFLIILNLNVVNAETSLVDSNKIFKKPTLPSLPRTISR